MKIGRVFYFDAAHYLTKYKKGGKCEKLHGHTYKLEVVIEGEVGEEGMVMDFKDLKEMANSKVLKELDHENLNDKFENPTVENIARWIFDRLKKGGKIPVKSVRLWEGKGKWTEVP